MSTLVVFTEEMSARVMLESLLPRLLPRDVHFLCVAFEGKQDLEKQVPVKLKGWRKPETNFVMLRDQDSGDCRAIKKHLRATCAKADKPDVLIRIACRELESWYFGDLAAVEKAMDMEGLTALQSKPRYRDPDRIYSPAKKLKELTKNRYQKVSSSRLIGKHLSLNATRSKSFRHFIKGVRRMMELGPA